MDYASYNDAVALRRECQRLGVDPCTGVVTDVSKRCEIYRARIAEHHEKQTRAAEAKVRNEMRPYVHDAEKRRLRELALAMQNKQLLDACDGHDVERVVRFVKKDWEANVETARGVTPLLCMITRLVPIEVLDDVLTRRVDVNAFNKHGYSALILACRMRESKYIHAVHKGGADVLARTPTELQGRAVKRGYAAVHWCAVHGCEDEIR